MESLAHAGSIFLMAVFAAGVIGCAITVPICAFRFFAVLFERSEQQSQIEGYRLVPVYAGDEPATASASPPSDNAPPSPPGARGAAAGK